MSTTVTVTTAMGTGLAFGAILTVLLIVLLVAREMLSAGEGLSSVRWGRVLNLALVPLAISFLFTVGLKVAAAL